MNLKDLLLGKGVDPQHVLVLRHRPWETELNKVFPWLAAEKPDLFNAFQQSHWQKVEKAMTQAKYVAAFIGHEPGKALFVGLYSNKGAQPISREQFWKIPANVELKKYGMNGFTEKDPRTSCLWFDLALTDFYADWKGKLMVRWPPLDRSWYRWAHKPKNEMPVLAILDESALDGAMPEWDALDLTWEELSILPTRLKSKLREWRGVYYIFDTSDGKGYVGSAYGESNLLGRWENYAARGHGGNRLLRQRDPRNFRFTILEIDAPNRNAGDVIRLESSWKERLHTRKPYGLNDN
jgi:hypothetical protein